MTGQTSADRYETGDRIARVLVQLSWVAQRRFTQHVGRHGLTLPQYLTLAFLIRSQHNRCAMKQLAEATQQDAATMTGVIDRLERLGLVERRRNPLDRRMVLVQPTDAAVALYEQIRRSRKDMVREFFEPFDNEEMHTLLSMLDRLVTSLRDQS